MTLGPEGFIILVNARGDRGCEFRECLAYTDDGKNIKFFEGFIFGAVSDRPRGKRSKEEWSGLWQIFIPQGGFSKTIAEMNDEERAHWRKTRGNNAATKFAKWFSAKK